MKIRKALQGLLIATVVTAITLALAPAWSPLVGLGPPSPPAKGEIIVTLEGRSFNVLRFGRSGNPKVVLVHGRPGSAYDWRETAVVLAGSGFEVYAFDRAGYGYSSPRPVGEAYDFESNANDLSQLFEALSIEHAHIFGWSFGGGVAQVFARQSPQRVRSLVLIASVTPYSNEEAESIDWGERILQLTEPIQRWGINAGFASRPGIERMGNAYFSGEMPEYWIEHMQSTLALPGAVHTWVEEGRDPGFDRILPAQISVPTLIIMGTRDVTDEFEVAERLNEDIKMSHLIKVEGGSHMLPNTHASTIVTTFLTFLGPPPIHDSE